MKCHLQRCLLANILLFIKPNNNDQRSVRGSLRGAPFLPLDLAAENLEPRDPHRAHRSSARWNGRPFASGNILANVGT